MAASLGGSVPQVDWFSPKDGSHAVLFYIYQISHLKSNRIKSNMDFWSASTVSLMH